MLEGVNGRAGNEPGLALGNMARDEPAETHHASVPEHEPVPAFHFQSSLQRHNDIANERLPGVQGNI